MPGAPVWNSGFRSISLPSRCLCWARMPCSLSDPTGRIIGRREGLSPDMTQVIGAAAARGVALEINANHRRLDLRDTQARAAIEAGVKLSINTDAHGPDYLDELIYGVLTARRAGVGRDDVINCMTPTGLLKWIRSTRP